LGAPDHSEARADDTDVDVGFYCRPQVEQLQDGSWRGRYPTADWSVVAGDRESAIEKVKQEDQRRLREQPGYMARQYQVMRQHLIEPISGVYAFSKELGGRIRESPNAEVGFERIADEMDAGKIPNPLIQ
jgi:hypothetical protein